MSWCEACPSDSQTAFVFDFGPCKTMLVNFDPTTKKITSVPPYKDNFEKKCQNVDLDCSKEASWFTEDNTQKHPALCHILLLKKLRKTAKNAIFSFKKVNFWMFFLIFSEVVYCRAGFFYRSLSVSGRLFWDIKITITICFPNVHHRGDPFDSGGIKFTGKIKKKYILDLEGQAWHHHAW